jgi:hypothetical protein
MTCLSQASSSAAMRTAKPSSNLVEIGVAKYQVGSLGHDGHPDCRQGDIS